MSVLLIINMVLSRIVIFYTKCKVQNYMFTESAGIVSHDLIHNA